MTAPTNKIAISKYAVLTGASTELRCYLSCTSDMSRVGLVVQTGHVDGAQKLSACPSASLATACLRMARPSQSAVSTTSTLELGRHAATAFSHASCRQAQKGLLADMA